MFLYWKGVNIFFNFLWICKFFYCYCICNCVKNINLLYWVYKKINCFLFFHPPILHSNIYKRRGTFFERMGVGRYLIKANVSWGELLYVKQTVTNNGGDGCQKLEISSKRTFWMVPIETGKLLFAWSLFRVLTWKTAVDKIFQGSCVKTIYEHIITLMLVAWLRH